MCESVDLRISQFSRQSIKSFFPARDTLSFILSAYLSDNLHLGSYTWRQGNLLIERRMKQVSLKVDSGSVSMITHFQRRQKKREPLEKTLHKQNSQDECVGRTITTIGTASLFLTGCRMGDSCFIFFSVKTEAQLNCIYLTSHLSFINVHYFLHLHIGVPTYEITCCKVGKVVVTLLPIRQLIHLHELSLLLVRWAFPHHLLETHLQYPAGTVNVSRVIMQKQLTRHAK